MKRLAYLLVCVLWVGAACVPASTPPQLEFTAGPPVMVDDDRYTTADFSVRVPQGWRVITAPAEQPEFVLFAAPDNRALMRFATRLLEPLPALDALPADEQMSLEVQASTVYASLRADRAQIDTLLPLFERTQESIIIR